MFKSHIAHHFRDRIFSESQLLPFKQYKHQKSIYADGILVLMLTISNGILPNHPLDLPCYDFLPSENRYELVLVERNIRYDPETTTDEDRKLVEAGNRIFTDTKINDRPGFFFTQWYSVIYTGLAYVRILPIIQHFERSRDSGLFKAYLGDRLYYLHIVPSKVTANSETFELVSFANAQQ